MRAAAVAAALCAGCVGIPFATPPVQLALGGGVRATAPRDGSGPATWTAPGEVRAAVHPLQMFPSLLGRRLDVGAGYMLEQSHGALQGPYLELAGALARVDSGERVVRFSARGQYRVLLDPAGQLGQGAALQLAVEFAGFADGPFDSTGPDGGAFGHAFGETGAGVFLESGVFAMGRVQGWTATGGLLLRLPALVGFAWGWIR